MSCLPPSQSIVGCPELLWRSALDCLFHDWPENQRRDQVSYLLGTAHDGGLEGLLVALNNGQIQGAVLSRPLGGKAALVWAPRLVDNLRDVADDLSTNQRESLISGTGEVAPDQPATETLRLALLTQLLDQLGASGVGLVQTLLTTDAASDERLFAQAGFTRLADLVYLLASNTQASAAEEPRELEFETYRSMSHERFKQLVERTYEGSLDCPALDGVRDVEDVLAGYRVTGRFDPRNWLIVRAAGQDVGCLILADDPRLDQWELIYMGLVPEARGRRWGRLLVAHAQRLAAQAGRRHLMLSVDAANGPAVRTYTHAGFVQCDVRRVLFRLINEPGTDPAC